VRISAGQAANFTHFRQNNVGTAATRGLFQQAIIVLNDGCCDSLPPQTDETMFRRLYDYGTAMSDGLTMLVVGTTVLVARVVGLPATAINMGVGAMFIVSGLIVVQGRRIQAKDKEVGASMVRWGFWLFSLCAGVFVAHNTLGMAV
jgi:hypothetical protein